VYVKNQSSAGENLAELGLFWLSIIAPGREQARYFLNLIGPPGLGILPDGCQAANPLLPLLTVRPLLGNNGGIVLAEALQSQAKSLCQYAERRGLIRSAQSSFQRILWVDDPWNYAALRAHLEQSGSQLDFYQGSPVVSTFFGESVRQKMSTALVAAEFSDKTRFKQLVSEVASRLGIAVNEYPRARVDYRDPRCISRALASLSSSARQLFVQGCVGAGGLRNFIIDLDGEVVLPGDHAARDVADIAAFFYRERLSAEMAPLLPIEQRKSFSFGVVIVEDGQVVAGPRYQILGRDLDYQGFYATPTNLPPDIDGESGAESFSREWRAVLDKGEAIALEVAYALRAQGYRGPLSIDFFVYQDEGLGTGYRLGVAEANMRRDGTSFLTSLLLGVMGAEGVLSSSVQCLDHYPVTHATLDELVSLLERSSVPLFSGEQHRGVVFLTPPMEVGGEERSRAVCVGFVEESPERLRSLVQAFKQAVN
jgi:hypothetical protein